MRAVAGAAAIPVLLILLACGSVDEEETGPPDITGSIALLSLVDEADELEREGGVLAGAVIEGVVGPDVQHETVTVTVTKDTRVFRRENGETRAATFEALEEGQPVEVWYWPPLGTYAAPAARQIVILEQEPPYGFPSLP